MVVRLSRRKFGNAALALVGGLMTAAISPRRHEAARSFEPFSLAGWGGPKLGVYFHRPAAWTPDWPVLIILHGAKRNLEYTMSTWLPLAQSVGFMPVIPHFTTQAFRGEKFALGGIARGDVPASSAFNAIEPLFDTLRQLTGTRRTSYSLFGHSAGAQFVQRFLLFNPRARAGRSVASMAGWYTLPEDRLPWPYGFANVSADASSFAAMLRRDALLLLGGNDDDPNAGQLRRSSLAQRQGANRLERGRNFFAHCTDFARRHDIPMNWQLSVLPHADHSSRAAARACAAWLAHRT